MALAPFLKNLPLGLTRRDTIACDHPDHNDEEGCGNPWCWNHYPLDPLWDQDDAAALKRCRDDTQRRLKVE